jgi:hypothetical protein
MRWHISLFLFEFHVPTTTFNCPINLNQFHFAGDIDNWPTEASSFSLTLSSICWLNWILMAALALSTDHFFSSVICEWWLVQSLGIFRPMIWFDIICLTWIQIKIDELIYKYNTLHQGQSSIESIFKAYHWITNWTSKFLKFELFLSHLDVMCKDAREWRAISMGQTRVNKYEQLILWRCQKCGHHLPILDLVYPNPIAYSLLIFLPSAKWVVRKKLYRYVHQQLLTTD